MMDFRFLFLESMLYFVALDGGAHGCQRARRYRRSGGLVLVLGLSLLLSPHYAGSLDGVLG